MARPTKLTQELQDKIVDVIRAGNYIETAASFAGLSKNTLYDWMKRGARERERIDNTGKKMLKKEQPFVEFSDAIEKALAEAEMRDVLRIGEASKSDWKAAAWRLERKFPQRWGKKFQQIENDDERRMKLLLMELEIAKKKLELQEYTGGGGEDAHDQIAAYAAALEGQVQDAFSDEIEGEPHETD